MKLSSSTKALVDVIDPNGFKNLGLDEMADTGSNHYGDRNVALDFLNERRVWHARNASLRWVRDNKTTCTGLFGDLGMFGDLGSILIFSLSSLFFLCHFVSTSFINFVQLLYCLIDFCILIFFM